MKNVIKAKSLIGICLLGVSALGCGRIGASTTGTSFNAGTTPTAAAGFTDLYSLTFDGSTQYLQSTTTPVTAYPFSISAWVRSASATDQTILGLFDSTVTTRYYRIRYTATGNIRAECSNTTNRSSAYTVNFADGNWHFVVGVFQSNVSRTVYVDGVAATVNAGACTYFNPNRITMGRNGGSTSNFYLNGNVSEAALWTVGLTAAEVTSLYNAGVPPDVSANTGNYASASSLISSWRMGDSTGDSAAVSMIDAATGTYPLSTFNMTSGNLSTSVP